MRDNRDYFKSIRWYKFQHKVGRSGAFHYYTNVHHWRLREWHSAPKLYSN